MPAPCLRTPAVRLLTPGRRLITPGRRLLTPGRRLLTPARRLLSRPLAILAEPHLEEHEADGQHHSDSQYPQREILGEAGRKHNRADPAGHDE
jgi:hypothetical protein